MQKSSRLSKKNIPYDVLSRDGIEISENTMEKVYWTDKDLDNVVKKYDSTSNVISMETDDDKKGQDEQVQDKSSELNNSVLSMEKTEDDYDWRNHYELMSVQWEQNCEVNKMISYCFLNFITDIPYHKDAFWVTLKTQGNRLYELKKDFQKETSIEKKEQLKHEIYFVQKNMNTFVDSILKMKI